MPEDISYSFLSDNAHGVPPEAVEAFSLMASCRVHGYGDDMWTREFDTRFRGLTGAKEVFHACVGTGANAVALEQLLASAHGGRIICSDITHLRTTEGNAIVAATKKGYLPVHTKDGKLGVGDIEPILKQGFDAETGWGALVSIDQPDVLNRVYTPDEIRLLADCCHKYGALLYVDGARWANAVAALKVKPSYLADCGVDASNFGWTKLGVEASEIVSFFNPDLALRFKALLKDGGQIASKVRFQSAMMLALLNDDKWLQMAEHGNEMAKLLAASVEGVVPVVTAETNAAFLLLDPGVAKELKEKYGFYDDYGDPSAAEKTARFSTAFDTSQEEVAQLAADIKSAVARQKKI